ncbi:methyl-accepting chemotaxis protein [Pseudomonas sp. SJZ103]|uniref:methyl-accepting chemotaxis protein n=2 Tax=Pseudomonas TaxID=286 RepID=UPI0011A15227|nr:MULTISPECIES: methyl-accepting chemotaxis protein [unclassified Pseudomonas]MBB6290762.1 methyl-accepting chemotaxis protein [Pseudomonas sp. SJZ073]MBB6315510.1 methyl-accepting chemotaxis protein [Pseudomonas sp. JAI120]TWC61531.1 methyl-accepting chemotaxis protein [Pseudomonas sp. SJZ103]TWC78727.1 methyl-accepting chemotaxis protein [Pseudomonas sp. SJZ094]
MGNFSIKSKLAFMAGFATLMLMLVGLSGWNGIRQLSAALDHISNETDPAVSHLLTLRLGQLGTVNSTREMIGWSLDQFDAIDDKTLIIEEAHAFYSSVAQDKESAELMAAQAYDSYAKLPKNPEEIEAWKSVQSEWTNFKDSNDSIRRLLEQLRTATSWGALRQNMSEVTGLDQVAQSAVNNLAVALDKLIQLNKGYANQAKLDGEHARQRALQWILAMSGAAVLGLGLITFLVARNIVGALTTMRSTIVEVAQSNDFTLRAQIRGRDETSQTARAFNQLLDKLQLSLREVLNNADQLSQVSDSAYNASRHVSASSTSQSEAATLIAAAVEQMSVSIGQVSESTQDALLRAQQAGETASQGSAIITRNTLEMDLIAATVSDTGITITDLGQQSDKISLVMQVIRDVAEQTNLLALNAAIEAARAGEQGRGFAVVADEVRKLAGRTSVSSDEIAQVVTTIQASAREAMTRMLSVTDRVVAGKQLSDQVADRMQTIRVSASQVGDAIDLIASAIDQQNTATQDIARRVELVARMSEENSQSASQTSEISSQLNTLARSLQATAGQFRV